MSRLNFIDRLQTGEVLVMDGATGSELQRRGVDVDKGSVEGKLGVWSAAANLDAPDARPHSGGASRRQALAGRLGQ